MDIRLDTSYLILWTKCSILPTIVESLTPSIKLKKKKKKIWSIIRGAGDAPKGANGVLWYQLSSFQWLLIIKARMICLTYFFNTLLDFYLSFITYLSRTTSDGSPSYCMLFTKHDAKHQTIVSQLTIVRCKSLVSEELLPNGK